MPTPAPVAPQHPSHTRRASAGAAGAGHPIHIFRPGRHTAMQGQSLDFSEADLAATAAAYNPALHEAPLVIGHPAANGPAYGWVAGLTAGAEGLFAVPRQLEPAFAEEVRSGRYKKVSASFYAPDSPHNPAPGVYYLRHVGFLGAQPPAVKGLAPVQFAEGDTEDGCLTLEFSESGGAAALLKRMAALFRGLRDYLIDKDGRETADKVIPSWTMDWLQEDAAAEAAGTTDIPAFTEAEKKRKEAMPESHVTAAAAAAQEMRPPAEDAAFAESQARAAELEKNVAALTAAARRGRAQAAVDKALAEGRITPAQSAGLADFMVGLEEEDVFQFAEGGKSVATSPAAFMTAFLARLPRQVDFAEISKDSHDTIDGLSPGEAARQALCYQEEMRQKGLVISVTEALDAVKAGKSGKGKD